MQASSIKEFISLIGNAREALVMLFDVRPDACRRSELLEGKVTEENLERLIEYGVVENYEGKITLDARVVDFFEDFLQVGDVNTGIIGDIFNELNTNIKICKNDTNPKYFNKIKRLLQRLNTHLSSSIVRLYNLIDETYKNEPNFDTKIIKLQHYRQERDRIAEHIIEVKTFLENYHSFFQLSDREMNNIVLKLDYSLIYNRRYLVELQDQILEYIHKVRQQSEIYHKIHKIKEFKDSRGGLSQHNSNIAEVVAKADALAMQTKKLRFKTHVPTELLLDEAGYRIVDKVRQKLRIRMLPRTIQSKALVHTDNQEEIFEKLNIDSFVKVFVQSDMDLFSFILSYNFPPQLSEMNVEKRVTLFVEISMDYESVLDFGKPLQFGDYTYANAQNEHISIRYLKIFTKQQQN